MNLKKHYLSEFAGTVPREFVVNSFREAVDLMQDCRKVYQLLQKYEDGEFDEFDLTDEVGLYSSFYVSDLQMYCHCLCSTSVMVNKYMKRTMEQYVSFSENLNKAIKACFCINEDEIKVLLSQAYNVISGVSFFCMVEFNLFDSIPDTGDVVEMDEIAFSYCRLTNKDPNDFVRECHEFATSFRPKFDVFDSYPELELEFQKVMGPNIIGVNEEYLTLEMVKEVLSGVTSPEQLVATVARLEEEEAS